MIAYGVDNVLISHPLLVDSSGRIIVSALDLTTTGGKLRVDASGNLYVAPMRPHAILSEAGVTQITANNVATNATVVLRTVTNGKTLYVTSLYLSAVNASAVNADAFIDVRNASAVVQYSWQLPSVPGQRFSVSIPLLVPISVPANYDVALRTAVANVYALGTLIGYEL